MSKVVQLAQTIAAKLAKVNKALASAAAVLVTLQATVGVPANVKDAAAQALAVLAAFGITYRVPNKP